MPENFAVRITRSYDYVKPIVCAWALKCDKMIVYEHEGSVTEKVHVHMLLIGCNTTKDTLKNIARPLGAAVFKGNAEWSFKTKDKKYGEVTDTLHMVTYMSKGKHDPKYNKGYTNEDLVTAKAAWVDRSNKSKLRVQYELFRLSLSDDIIPLHAELNELTAKVAYRGFDIVRKKALGFAHGIHNVISPATINLMKTLTLTHCYEKGIEMPLDRVWK